MAVFSLTSLLFFLALCVPNSSCLPAYCGKGAEDYAVPKIKPVEGYELKQVQVVIRHGDRTRAGYSGPCWSNDKAVWDCTLTSFSHPTIKHDQHSLTIDRVYRKIFLDGREPMLGDCPLGVLTFKGYKQQELNGINLRDAYVKTGFLKQNYSYTDMFLRSDDESRTMQSAQSLLLGMYPTSAIKSDRSQVVDIHTMDSTFDSIEPNARLCPKISEYNRDFFASALWKKYYSTVMIPLLEQVQKALGTNTSLNMDNLEALVDCIHTHQCHSFDIPAAITDDLFQRMVKGILFMWNAQFNFPTREKFAKAGIGFLVSDMWQAMQKRMLTGKGKKFLLYSGHDFTLVPLLVALNISDGQWPPYASVFRLELYQNASIKTKPLSASYAVRVIYNEKELKLPFCDASPCIMGQFENYVNTIIPQDPKTECHVNDSAVLQRPLGRLRHMIGRSGH